MTDHTTACTRGCTAWGRHLSDCHDTAQPGHEGGCCGCAPRETDVGLLCRRCVEQLQRLLGRATDTESVAWACRWLADNLGQHIRHNSGGKPSGDGATRGDHLVETMDALSGLQLAVIELVDDFRESRRMDRRTTTDVAKLTTWLRPWLSLLAEWEPIGATLDHFLDHDGGLMAKAHAVAPWRGRDPETADRVAAVLYLAPAEPSGDIRSRFALGDQWLKKARLRKDLRPAVEGRPHWWRPWDVYRVLHPAAAERYEARLAKQAQTDDRLVYATGGDDVAQGA